jgi:hypothetical protein
LLSAAPHSPYHHQQQQYQQPIQHQQQPIHQQQQQIQQQPIPPQSQQQVVTKHVYAPIDRPISNNGGLPAGQNICADCERLIV